MKTQKQSWEVLCIEIAASDQVLYVDIQEMYKRII